MESEKLLTPPIQEQVKEALDGRTHRWLSLECKISEYELSRKMNGKIEFTDSEIERINQRLNSNISK